MKDAAHDSPDALLGVLNSAPKGALRGHKGRWLLAGAGGVLALAVIGWLVFSGDDDSGGRYVAEAAQTGNLVVTVSASGTLQPTKSVDVGSEQSGTLASVLVQENDLVKKGQLLAQIDPAKLKDAVAKSKAALAAAEAARNAAQLSRNLYQSGLADFQKVLETERTRLSAEDNLAIAEATMRSDLIKLYKALGGGWEAGAVQEISKDRAS